MTFKGLTAMFINITIFWDVKSSCLVHRHQYFRGTYCFNPKQRHSIWKGRTRLETYQWQWSGVIKSETHHHLRFSLMCFLQLQSSLITNFLTLYWNIFHTCIQKLVMSSARNRAFEQDRQKMSCKETSQSTEITK